MFIVNHKITSKIRDLPNTSLVFQNGFYCVIYSGIDLVKFDFDKLILDTAHNIKPQYFLQMQKACDILGFDSLRILHDKFFFVNRWCVQFEQRIYRYFDGMELSHCGNKYFNRILLNAESIKQSYSIKSDGHLEFIGEFEFFTFQFTIKGQALMEEKVYYSKVENSLEVLTGQRIQAREYCNLSQWFELSQVIRANYWLIT